MSRISITIGDAPRNSRTSSSFLNFKCCVVGDSGVGKTAMLMAYCLEDWLPNKGGFMPSTYVPSRPFIIPSADSRTCITLTIKDTRGLQDSEQLTAYDCSGADCLIICFSVVDPESFFNVENRWLPFMAKICPDAACILVGTKTDLRQQQPQPQRRVSVLQGGGGGSGGGGGGGGGDLAEDSGRSSRRISVLEVTGKMGAKMAKKIHAFEYLECSSMNKESLNAVFHTAVRTFTDESSPADRSAGGSAQQKDKTDSGGGSGGRKKCSVS